MNKKECNACNEVDCTEKKGNVSVEAAQAVLSRQKNRPEFLEDWRPCVLVDKQMLVGVRVFFPSMSDTLKHVLLFYTDNLTFLMVYI